MSAPPWSLQVALVLLVALAAWYDLRYRRIPNWLVVMGAMLGIGLNVLLDEGPGLERAFKGMGLALAIYVPLWWLRAMGAGDVKLMAAVGANVGPANWLGVFLLASLLGGVIAVILVLMKGRLKRTLENVVFLLRELAHLRAPYVNREELDVGSPTAVRLPHGAVVALGSAAFLMACAVLAP